VADHQLLSVSILAPVQQPISSTFISRNLKSFDDASFIDRLPNASFICNPHNDANDFYEQMSKYVIHALNDIAPLLKTPKRQGCSSRPELSHDAMTAKRNRRLCERTYARDRSESNHL